MNKNIALLYMLETLTKKGWLGKKDITEKLELTDVSFYRYLRSLRNYLKYANDGRSLNYDRNSNIYILVNKVIED